LLGFANFTNFSFALKFAMFAGIRCLLKQLKQQQWKIHRKISLLNVDLVSASNDIKKTFIFTSGLKLPAK